MSGDDAISFVLRHEYGRVVAALLREFGGARLAQIEDGLAQAMLEAMSAWRSRGAPPSARAWLHRAARHRIIDELRRGQRLDADVKELTQEAAEVALSDDVTDDELRALYACAVPEIPLPSQVVFALRTLAGFSTHEVATRLVTSEENVQKRFERAREAFQGIDVTQALTGPELEVRTEAVLRMIYVLFTEGYFASSGPMLLKLELCNEAIRLAQLIVEHPRVSAPNAIALLALLHLHHARRDARADADGLPVLLEDQDRSRYRRDELSVGLSLLMRAAEKGLSSKYHLEAAIAVEHAFAPSFAETRWTEIVRLYDRLQQVEPSPLHTLHNAIAVSYASGPEAGLALLNAFHPPTWLDGSHLWLATLADMYARAGQRERALDLFGKAIALAPELERAALTARRERMR